MNLKIDEGSYKDPSGFIFYVGSEVFRQVNLLYKENYDLLLQSGLYNELTMNSLLIPHQDVTNSAELSYSAYKILKPEKVKLVSYPYEWSFSMLKDAALTTLEIQDRALKYGMSLKDASAYNIQFHKGKPVFIDTLSFEKYREGLPWVAYGQFCRHFIAPLALMSYVDVRTLSLLQSYLDGIPLDLAVSLLKKKVGINILLGIHIGIHNRSIKNNKHTKVKASKKYFSKNAISGLIDSLRMAIEKLHWDPKQTTWSDYYSDTNYSSSAFLEKKRLVKDMISRCTQNTIVDLGANNGIFSRIAAETERFVISCDLDPGAVERNYLTTRSEGITNILPLLVDISNPSPAMGWNDEERKSLIERLGSDSTVLALALLHHLAIGSNIPIAKIIKFFTRIGEEIIIEFVPKSDSQVEQMLSIRDNIFDEYSFEKFCDILSLYMKIDDIELVGDSGRILIKGHSLVHE